MVPPENTTYRRATRLMEADLAVELVALDPEQGLCFGFNEAAAYVWRKLSAPATFAELRDELLDAFDVSEDECTKDLHDLLDDLVNKGLVSRG